MLIKTIIILIKRRIGRRSPILSQITTRPCNNNCFEKLHAIDKIIICPVLMGVYLMADIKDNAFTRLMIGWNTSA